jgi:hypothetical protein
MRLIDADELKEHKFVGNKYVQIGGRTNGKTLENINKAYQQGWNDAIDAIIDNAPTVCGNNPKWCESCVSKGKCASTRPQGEWIIVKDEKWGDNVKCPFCGKELAGTDLNFCCKCGAKLIGSEKTNGGEEE